MLGVRTSDGDSSPFESPVRSLSKGGSGAVVHRPRSGDAAPETSSARFGRRSVPAGADAGRFGSPVPDGYSNRVVHDWLGAEPAPIRRRTEPVPERFGNGPKSSESQATAAESSVRVETDWLKPSQSQDSAARAACGSFSGGSPRCTIPADRPSRAATDGKRRHPGPASPSGAAALPKALAMVRRRRVLEEGRQASALRPHGWKASKAGPRTTRSGSCHGCASGTPWAVFRLRRGSPQWSA